MAALSRTLPPESSSDLTISASLAYSLLPGAWSNPRYVPQPTTGSNSPVDGIGRELMAAVFRAPAQASPGSREVIETAAHKRRNCARVRYLSGKEVRARRDIVVCLYCSYVAQREQDQENNEQQAYSSCGSVSPTTAMRPAGKHPNQYQDKDDQ